MIIFRSEVRTESTLGLAASLIAQQLRDHAPAHDAIVSWLIEAGELEAGVADEVNDGSEPPTPPEQALRAVTHLAARTLVDQWTGAARTSPPLNDAGVALAAAIHAPLPRAIRITTPEGFAHYGVYPESYIEAARRFAASRAPARAAVFGIRSIGATLSAVVAAALEERGWKVASFTVRPSGHPYDRVLRLNPAWARTLRDWRDAWFAIVDEGPGRSGSSFAAVVNALEDAGIQAARIVIFPSWAAPGASLLNEGARQAWTAHERFVAEFDDGWLSAGRFSGPGGTRLIDASAGRWRDADVVAWRDTPVWPQVERRKFISADGAGRPTLLKFAGLGRYGRAKFERAQALSPHGFTVPVTALAHGFISQPWITPAARPQWNEGAANTMARYLAFIARRFPVARGVGATETMAMLSANLQEGLGSAAAPLIAYAARHAALFEARPVAIDGRMLPAEWIADGTRLLKTDALDHHADHLFPGPQNIAWDVAGTCIEFDLDADATQGFVRAAAAHLGEPQLGDRLPLFSIAYLAFRLGYAQTAADAMTGSRDGDGFARLANRYRERLRAVALAA